MHYTSRHCLYLNLWPELHFSLEKNAPTRRPVSSRGVDKICSICCKASEHLRTLCLCSTIRVRLCYLVLFGRDWQQRFVDINVFISACNALPARTPVKGKGQYICIAPHCRQPTSKALRYGNSLSRDLTVLPAFAFPAEAGTHLPTAKRWKAELAWATRTASKQSAQDCYAMFIGAANRSKHHASLGK